MDINEKDKDLTPQNATDSINQTEGGINMTDKAAHEPTAPMTLADPEGGAPLKESDVEENKIKIISPGRMVLKRFFRSRLSVIGLVTLIVLFAFSIFGPMFSQWGEVEMDVRPTPAFNLDYAIEYTEKIETETGIAELAEVVLGSAKATKNENLSALYKAYDFENNAVAGPFVINPDEDPIYFEVEYDMGDYTIYLLEKNPEVKRGYSRINTDLVRRSTSSRTLNLNDTPTKDHWLGTDSAGYDIFTRLMYAGRISLTLGFVVVFISTFIGVLMGGIAGYFGKWIDLIIMRIIDIIYCLPQLPIMLIFSAILDGMEIDEGIRIYFLMALLSLLGWAGIARTVRGQILTLREQEFMVAAEALGISIPRRIIKHLVPNVMPLLIVSMTLSLGGTILTEATLSFLGLGIRPPKAAWGTMISSANDPLILQYYPNQWVPAGVMIILAVLAFNFVGDGLRDAFDPKMKR